MTALSRSGVVAALVIGAIALRAGTDWAVLLLLFFAGATVVSRFRRETKRARAGGIIDKPDARDAVQVAANGGVFALGAVLYTITGEPGWMAFAAGALAAASADTWATELGLLAAARPRSIISGQPVPPGTSGGVTLAGTAAGVLGALVVTAAALALGWGTPGVAAGAGGILGMTADSVLGATVQERRWCPRCSAETERRVHTCGDRTDPHRGMPWLRNDAVNGIATIVGAAAAVLLHGWLA